jgi:hypothetical protein
MSFYSQMLVPKSWVPSSGAQGSGFRTWWNLMSWKNVMYTFEISFYTQMLSPESSKIFESTFHISVNILLTPEPQKCGLPGFGVQGFRVWDSDNLGRLTRIDFQKNWFTTQLIYTFVDDLTCQHPTPGTWHSGFRVRPSSPQFQGSGVGKIFTDIWKVDSNIFEKCLFHLKYCPKSWVLSPGSPQFRGSGINEMCRDSNIFVSFWLWACGHPEFRW